MYGIYLSDEQWNEILQAAIDWQYLIVLNGGMARKSDCDEWLMQRYGIVSCTAREITNTITSGPRYFICSNGGVEWMKHNAGRAAPKAEDYPDIDYSKGNL